MQSNRPSIPQDRIRQKVDDLMSRRDYPGVERHLKYWLGEARLLGDRRGELMVLNELIGHCRKTGDRDQALAFADQALSLIDSMDFGGTLSEGTTLVNIATALNAFSENARALELFERARGIYEAARATDPSLLGGLYNNMALTCASLGRYDEAEALFNLAMTQMAQVPQGALEQAVTLLNLADLVEARQGLLEGEKDIDALMERAAALLHRSDVPRDGYYAFVCEKCAPVFDHYGYFLEATWLIEEAARIYEGH